MPRFLVCGEALLDVFQQADTPAGMMLEARIGGSPLNVAIGLARLGERVAFLGGISTDPPGERLMRALRAEGVDAGWVQRMAAPSTLALVGEDTQGRPAYAFHGAGAADRGLDAARLPATLPQDVELLQLGSYALVVEPTASALRTLVEREWRQRLVAYDPNVRLNVEPDLQRWREALDWMLPRCALLKISTEDLALLYPQAEDAAALARHWLARGPQLVVITDGAAGASAWCANGLQLSRPARPVSQLVDSVGAGDSFQAALLTALAAAPGRLDRAALQALSAEHLAAALDFAAQAAALCCERRGADLPGMRDLPASAQLRGA
jgi:fructokinase